MVGMDIRKPLVRGSLNEVEQRCAERRRRMRRRFIVQSIVSAGRVSVLFERRDKVSSGRRFEQRRASAS